MCLVVSISVKVMTNGAYSPLVGGALSNPATKYSYFSNLELFIVFPYLLPCLAVAGMTLIAAVVGSVFLAEIRSPKFRLKYF